MVENVMTKVTNWNTVWFIMTALSALLMAVFGLLFRDDVLAKKAVPAGVVPSTN
jgi:hypothetical protein